MHARQLNWKVNGYKVASMHKCPTSLWLWFSWKSTSYFAPRILHHALQIPIDVNAMNRMLWNRTSKFSEVVTVQHQHSQNTYTLLIRWFQTCAVIRGHLIGSRGWPDNWISLCRIIEWINHALIHPLNWLTAVHVGVCACADIPVSMVTAVDMPTFTHVG